MCLISKRVTHNLLSVLLQNKERHSSYGTDGNNYAIFTIVLTIKSACVNTDLTHVYVYMLQRRAMTQGRERGEKSLSRARQRVP